MKNLRKECIYCTDEHMAQDHDHDCGVKPWIQSNPKLNKNRMHRIKFISNSHSYGYTTYSNQSKQKATQNVRKSKKEKFYLYRPSQISSERFLRLNLISLILILKIKKKYLQASSGQFLFPHFLL